MSTTSMYKKLIMVTADNNNKYYEMVYNGGNSFTVNYGRVELTKTTISKPFKQWNSIYNEKLKKGYKDVTDLVSVTQQNSSSPTSLSSVGITKVDEFLDLMKKYTSNLVDKTYSVKATNVTQKQIDKAQSFIDDLGKLKQKSTSFQQDANTLLLQLYSIIPRRMSNVKDYLIPSINLDKSLEQEQDNLDAMAAQVSIVHDKPTKKAKKEVKTLLDVLGISMNHDSKKSYKDVDYLLKQQYSGRVEAIFEVNKPSEDKVFTDYVKNSKDKSTKILIHGTRCTSVIPILEQGLKIRPSGNFQFSGKAYGDGNYFSEVMSKSLNYVGYDNDKVLLVYEVHSGNPFVYDGWYRGNSFPLTFKELNSRGFDSTYVKAGNGLLNSEIITYTEKQNRIKYIIWLKNR